MKGVLTQYGVAKILSTSRSNVDKIERRALAKLRRALMRDAEFRELAKLTPPGRGGGR